MKITIFSSNQPRHLNLVNEFSKLSDEVYFICEVNTVFPGQIEDFYKKTKTMQTYFNRVIKSEKNIFGDVTFSNQNVKTLSIKSGDLNNLTISQLKCSLESDLYIVFGSSYIKGWLVDFLIEQKAINIHMGLSPYYRGSSCNFWALYDRNPEYVGATIHYLSKGLDSGEILFHCVPKPIETEDIFNFSMRSVEVAQKSLIEVISEKNIFSLDTLKQDNTKEIRYSKIKDFTDSIANEFLSRDEELVFKDFSYPELFHQKIK